LRWLSLSAVLAWAAISVASAAFLADARRHLKHVIIIMQENRSFDHYFGTFPGADGLPRDAQGNFTTCVPLVVHDPEKGCVKPFHDTMLKNAGGPHAHFSFVDDWDSGKMDGFVQQATLSSLFCLSHPDNPKCIPYRQHDVMGFHTEAEIPNYWTYAQTYMLQDHLFEPVGQMSLGAHLMMISEWAAHCTDVFNPMSCITTTDPLPLMLNPRTQAPLTTPFAWTNVTWLLDHLGVSWKYYIVEGGTPDCDDQDDSDNCQSERELSG
jgi:phospholipase C